MRQVLISAEGYANVRIGRLRGSETIHDLLFWKSKQGQSTLQISWEKTTQLLECNKSISYLVYKQILF